MTEGGRVVEQVLVRACEVGDVGVTGRILGVEGVDVNARVDVWGWTALIGAARYGRLEVAMLLVGDPRTDVNRGSAFGATPLLCACHNGQLGVVQTLLRVPGIDVNHADYVDKQTPLLCASHCGHLEVARALLGAPGIEVDLANARGQTPLWCACVRGHAEVATALMEAGAGVHVGPNGQSPLQALCEGRGGVPKRVRAVRAAAGPVLKLLVLGGLPQTLAVDILVHGYLDGWQAAVAMLLLRRDPAGLS